MLDRNQIIVNNIFAYKITLFDTNIDDEIEPQTVAECRRQKAWLMWKQAIKVELDSFTKRKVFGPIVQTSNGVTPVGYKWVLFHKRNEKNEIVHYKARLVAQGFSQKPGVDYEETYFSVMDVITFRFLITFVASKNLDMYLMIVVTTYLYGDLAKEIYMKLPDGFKLPEESYFVKLQRLNELKQGYWLNEYLQKQGFQNNEISPCIYIWALSTDFVLIVVYVNNPNIIGTPKEINKTTVLLTSEFEIKDLGKIKICLSLQIEYLPHGTLVHQSIYTNKILKNFL